MSQIRALETIRAELGALADRPSTAQSLALIGQPGSRFAIPTASGGDRSRRLRPQCRPWLERLPRTGPRTWLELTRNSPSPWIIQTALAGGVHRPHCDATIDRYDLLHLARGASQ